MIEKEKYSDFINDDIIGATVLFEELNLSEQFTVALYLIDNCIISDNIKTILTSSHYRKILMVIKVENLKKLGEDTLLDRSIERFKIDNPETQIIDKPIVDNDRVNNFYLLIK